MKKVKLKGKTDFFMKYLSKMMLTDNAEVLKKIWRLGLKRHVGKVIFVVVLILLFAGLDGYTISLLRTVLDVGFLQKNITVLKVTAIEIAFLFVCKAVTLYYSNTFLYSTSLRVSNTMRNKLFKKAMELDASFFEDNNAGLLVTRMLNDSTSAGELLRQIFTVFFMQFTTTIAMLVVMIYMSPLLSLFVLVGLPFAYFLIRFVNKKLRHIFSSSMQKLEILQSYLIQIFHNIPVLKIYNKEHYEVKHSSNIFHAFYKLQKKTYATQSASKPVIEVFTGVVIAIVMLLGGFLITKNIITLGSFIVFFTALIALYRPLKQLSGVLPQIQTQIIAAERYFWTYEAIPLVIDKPNAPELQIKTISSINFRNVEFAYPGVKEKMVLKNVSFSTKGHKVTALVGMSGSGKTTLFKLLCRFYNVSKGAITINGHNINEVTQHSLRKYIAMVTQDTYLFDDTIRHNIAYGAIDQAPSEVPLEQVIAAAKKADAHDFIMSLPLKYDTIIGERGVKLSGGQKQRLSIARAILKDAPILLLDEATSALDTRSERAVQHALSKLMENKTTLVIAHRLSTIVNADNILVLKDGHIIEQGSHVELLRNKDAGVYAKLYNTQFAALHEQH